MLKNINTKISIKPLFIYKCNFTSGVGVKLQDSVLSPNKHGEKGKRVSLYYFGLCLFRFWVNIFPFPFSISIPSSVLLTVLRFHSLFLRSHCNPEEGTVKYQDKVFTFVFYLNKISSTCGFSHLGQCVSHFM